MISIGVKGDMRALTRDLSRFARDQVPFATAQALTAVARKVAAAETELLSETFDKPTPFTLKAFAVRGARKSNLTASIFAKDRQAAYLSPYLDGGSQALGSKRAILTPIQVALNAYGNIPRGKLAALKGQPGYFVGTVQRKGARPIGGLWQRIPPPKVGRHRGHLQRKGHLKLLVEFTAPKQVTKRLTYEARARAVVARELPREFDRALRAALATAR